MACCGRPQGNRKKGSYLQDSVKASFDDLRRVMYDGLKEEEKDLRYRLGEISKAMSRPMDYQENELLEPESEPGSHNKLTG